MIEMTHSDHWFVIISTIKVSKFQVHEFIREHLAFVEAQRDAGIYISGGPRVPYEGSIVLARAHSREELENLLERDPGMIHGLYSYQVLEYNPRFFQV
jgi:uncharacterized protein YciI